MSSTSNAAKPASMKPMVHASNWFSDLMMWYLNPLLWLGSHRPLQPSDLGEALPQDKSSDLTAKFLSHWQAEVRSAAAKNAALGITPGATAVPPATEAESSTASDESADAKPKSSKPKGPKEVVPSMSRALRQTLGYEWLWAIFVFLVGAGLQFLPPLILPRIVSYLQNPARSPLSYNDAWIHVGGMLFCPLLATVLQNYHNNVMARVGTQMRTALTGAIYAKALVLRNTGTFTTGEIVQRMSVDAALPLRFVAFASQIIAAPPTIAVALYLIYRYVGVSTFSGLAFLMVALPLSGAMVGKLFKLRFKGLAAADKRVKLTNEALSGIRIVKFYGWERPMEAMISAIREEELAYNREASYSMQVNLSLLMLSLPIALPVIVFSMYTSLGNSLDAGTVFATISLFSILRMPLAFLPMGITMALQFKISLNRIGALLLAPEIEPVPGFDNPLQARETPIVIEHASFRWDAMEPPKPAPSGGAGGPPGGGMMGGGRGGAARGGGRGGRGGGRGGAAGGAGGKPHIPPEKRPLTLKDLTLSVKRGELVAVVGAVASGKSSLISAILGELPRVSGSIKRAGNIAYASQQPWVVNATLRENVLFGCEFDEARYNAVLDASALRPDLELLPAGDLTEIGEKGVNLSGGQKARVCLARAAYAANRADICAVLLDDPLAAVDSHVGAHLFSHCIGNSGFLAGTTRVLVTNALHVLPECDRVVVLGTGGVVRAIGTFANLAAEQPDLIDSLSALAENKPSGDAAASAAAGAVVAGASAASLPADTPISSAPAKVVAPVAAVSTPTAVDAATPTSIADVKAPVANANTQVVVVSNVLAVAKAAAVATPAASPTAATGKQQGGTAGKGGDLMSQEERATGSVDGAVVWAYLKANGAAAVLPCLLFSFAGTALQLASNFWISEWSQEAVAAAYRHQKIDDFYYLYVYVGLGLSSVAAITIRGIFLVHGRINSSRYLHALVLRRVLAAPVFFFDTTPLGRILNRFSRDVYTVDSELPMTVGQTLNNTLMVVGTLVSVAVSTNGVLLGPLVPLIGIYLWIQRFFRRSSTEIQRLESLARSPIFSGFSLVLSGVSTIRAYGREQRYTDEAAAAVDANTVPYLLSQLAGNWLGLWTNILSAVVAFLVACIAVGGQPTNLLSPAWTALALSASLELSGGLTQAVRMAAQLEAQMNSVERLVHYGKSVPQEAPWETGTGASEGKAELNKLSALALGLPSAPAGMPSNWPAKGEVVIRDLRMRYGRSKQAEDAAGSAVVAASGDDTPKQYDPESGDIAARFPPLSSFNKNTFSLGDEVLRGISFRVAAGSKLGIVGRTGSGKSSLAIALFRIVEACGGSIELDGVDTTAVPLALLRSRLSIIPQDPVLFSTNIRANVDPFGKHADADLKQALDQVRLGHLALDAPVAEGGSNLSVGERQLLCIARALLRKSSIIVFDEATASIDSATDAFVQQAIRNLFADATVLTIAHRLQTVADADAILVLDKGSVAEFGSPSQLLGLRPVSVDEGNKNPVDGGVKVSGAFRGMVDKLGLEAAAEVEKIALGEARIF